jgi:hypothetical protein
VNQNPLTGVWLDGAKMDALAASFPDRALSQDASLEQKFERRLADCPTLAYRVALGVLRNKAEAEDVATARNPTLQWQQIHLPDACLRWKFC